MARLLDWPLFRQRAHGAWTCVRADFVRADSKTWASTLRPENQLSYDSNAERPLTRVDPTARSLP